MGALMTSPEVSRAKGESKGDVLISATAATGALVLAICIRQIAATGLDMRHLAWLGLAALTLVVGRLSIRLPLPNCRVSFSDASIFLSLLAFGPALATVTGAIDGLASSTRGTTWYKRVFNSAGMAVSVFLSSHAFTLLLPAGGLRAQEMSSSQLLLPVATLAIVQYLVNTALVSAVVCLKESVPPGKVWHDASPWVGVGYVTGLAAAAFIFLAVREIGVGAALAVLPYPAVPYLTFRTCLGRLAKVKRKSSTA
jgi:uncharacterized membrane protein